MMFSLYLREKLKPMENTKLSDKTNEYVKRAIVSKPLGREKSLLVITKRRKISWLNYITRKDSLAKAILQGKVEDSMDGAHHTIEWKGCHGHEFFSRKQINRETLSSKLPF